MDLDTDNDGDCLDFDDTSSNPEGGAERYFYCQDANWNVIALRHDSNIIERYEYDPYGNVRIFKGYDSAEGHEDLTVVSDSIVRDVTDPPLPYGNPILFAGYFYDNETGLYHVRHRMYSPTLARWLQRDPVGYPAGQNLYEYVHSQPLNLRDPTGKWACIQPLQTSFEDDLPFAGITKLGKLIKWLRDKGYLKFEISQCTKVGETKHGCPICSHRCKWECTWTMHANIPPEEELEKIPEEIRKFFPEGRWECEAKLVWCKRHLEWGICPLGPKLCSRKDNYREFFDLVTMIGTRKCKHIGPYEPPGQGQMK